MKHFAYLFALLLITPSLRAQKPLPYLDPTLPIEARIDDALRRMTLEEKVRILHAQSKFSSAGIPRLGFPDFWTSDGPHGIRPEVLWDEWEQAGQTNDSCVAFPALTCLAATWDPTLAKRYGQSLGEEARYRRKNMILGPGVNIYRTPLNGRNFEYMGEDPYLASAMVVPYVEGLQGMGVAACVKHFALNNDEQNRHRVNVIVDDRTLHEIYLPAFKAAVTKGKAWAIMGAYNLYNNQHNCHNKILINDILKGQWQFDGVVVSDWGGTYDTNEAIHHGLDMEFGTGTDGLREGTKNAYENYYLAFPYLQLLKEGKLTTRELDDKVRRILRLFYRTTMSDHPSVGFMCSESHYRTANEIGQAGIVLLKNEGNLLPIDTQRAKRILVVGENAIKMMTVGGGSSSLKVQREVSPLDGLRQRLPANMQIDYERGYVGDVTGTYNGVVTGQALSDTRSESQLIADAVTKAQGADYVIVFGGLNKSDHQDCEGNDRLTYGLPYAQDRLIEALTKVNDRVVYVNISGNAVAMPWIDKVHAIVQGWFIGSEAGHALAAVLVGDANPSGKLPFTWPVALQDVAAHHLHTYPGTWREGHNLIDEEYKEGLFVGYRWVDKSGIKPLFAFGHGLSYTRFHLSDLKLSRHSIKPNESLTATVTVRNTGMRAGAEVVQLYVSDLQSTLPRPAKELKGFEKVYLKPGEQAQITFTIDRSALAYYSDRRHDWITEPGEFAIRIGTASDHLPLHANFTLQ